MEDSFDEILITMLGREVKRLFRQYLDEEEEMTCEEKLKFQRRIRNLQEEKSRLRHNNIINNYKDLLK